MQKLWCLVDLVACRMDMLGITVLSMLGLVQVLVSTSVLGPVSALAYRASSWKRLGFSFMDFDRRPTTGGRIRAPTKSLFTHNLGYRHAKSWFGCRRTLVPPTGSGPSTFDPQIKARFTPHRQRSQNNL